jgi:polyhydroxybutyrate depolymerase
LTFAQGTPQQADPLGPGDYTRPLMMGEQKRSYLVHVPKGYDPKKPAPVVLALHGAAMNGLMMVWFSGRNKKSDEAGFIVVYPSGTGTGPFLTWNAGGFRGKMAEGKANDVAFIGKLLDDLATVVKVDEKRVYACGMSNGGMMCYRLAAELSDRIAAIAPVEEQTLCRGSPQPPGKHQAAERPGPSGTSFLTGPQRRAVGARTTCAGRRQAK